MQSDPLTEILQRLLCQTEGPEVLLEAVANEEVIRSITEADAAKVADCIGHSNGQPATIAAHILTLLVEKLAALRGNYNCREAVMINRAIEKVFIAEDLQLQVAHCRLFNAHFCIAQDRFTDALHELDFVANVFRTAGDHYALACALLLRSESRLRISGDRDLAVDELFEAESLFKDHNDQLRVQHCKELRHRYLA